MGKSSNLPQIVQRHGRDRLKDALFIGLAVLLMGIAVGSVTSKAAGKEPDQKWGVTVIEQPTLLDQQAF